MLRIARGAALVVVLLVATGCGGAGEARTPAGFPRMTSLYVPMRDGVSLAVSVYLPADLRSGERVPVLMRTTRYWRSQRLGWLPRALIATGLADGDSFADSKRLAFTAHRFAVVTVDARGSGASEGQRPVEYGPDEIADLGDLVRWAAAQPWSSGRVGTFGDSYEGNTAELAAVPNAPALGAVMPLYADFDTTQLIAPGGDLLQGFLQPWSDAVSGLDRDDVCAAADAGGPACWLVRSLTSGVRPVDADPDGARLAALVARRAPTDVAGMARGIEYRDDAIVAAGRSYPLSGFSPYSYKSAIEASRVPMMVFCGWNDAATCDGALSRYLTLSNPQELVIGALTHGGHFNSDPFAASHDPPVPTRPAQLAVQTDFFERTLGPNPSPVRSSIRYYTMGEGRWHTTTTWPPADVRPRRLYFGEGRSLVASEPTAADGRDVYDVDFTVSSGDATRWDTQLGGSEVDYGDRAPVVARLLSYVSPRLQSDLVITGSPVVSLEMQSTSTDGVVHAYLDDVGPDGRVTYLDEGLLRLVHRKESRPAAMPYAPLGPAHSMLRDDAAPVVAGEPFTVRFALLATSIEVKRGHRLALSLAGADARLFARIPARGLSTWTVFRQVGRASYVELPCASAP